MRAKYRDYGLTSQRLKLLMDYDRKTGFLSWKESAPRYLAGKRAGCDHHSGYVTVTVDGHIYNAHCLVWLYVHGEWPAGEVDHKDSDRANNRISNLRDCSTSENKANGRRYKKASDLPKGVCRSGNRFRAQIVKDYAHTHLGYYDTPEEAHAAYMAAATRIHGKFARMK